MISLRWLMPVFLVLGAMALEAASPRDFAIDLKATVSDTLPHITISWTQRLQSNITAQKIHRRLKGATVWVKLADLSTTQTSYADPSALPGVEYEYWMQRSLNLTPNTAMGYLSAGVKVPEIHSRGKLLLVMDDTMVAPLAPEIELLKQDLAADGWVVVPVVAPRAGSAISTKALIKAAYDADPASVKQVYLLGHVPVPYSGLICPDGHGDHYGAWPADTYYADMDGTWTDTTANNTTSATDVRNHNVPGDGKFDQSNLPGLVELQVGRVDLSNMTIAPSSAATEATLLRRYLRKAHDYRFKLGAYASVPRRSLIRDQFGHNGSSEPFATVGWAGAFTNVGPTVDEAPSDQWFSSAYAGGQTYLWGHACGAGGYDSARGLGSTMDFGHLASRVVFPSIFGSWHGDWDSPNNLMRAVLAGTATGDSLGLCAFWQGRPNWYVHSLGMGETLGYMTRVSMNAGLTGGGGFVPLGSSAGGVHLGLMGDPALRIHAVEPPRGVAGTSAAGAATLTWNPSNETGLQGYHVYRATTPEGPYTKLTEAPLSGTSYTDSAASEGHSYTYLVRTLRLESVPGGSYYNLSVGAAIQLAVNSGGMAGPRNPSDLRIASQAAPINVPLTWQDNSSDETGFRVERRVGEDGAWSTLVSLPAGTTSHTDSGPFLAGNTYYYRVIATGAAGESLASNTEAFEAVAGYVAFSSARVKVDKSTGLASIPVTRFGGSAGALTVDFGTSNSTAIAGTHFTHASGKLSWADGEAGVKTISVPLANNATPQLPRQFRLWLSTPSAGAGLGSYSTITVLIEDPTASLDSPWTQTILNTTTDSSPAISAEGVIGDALIGGSGATADATSESGRFIYQSRIGDGMLTMKVPTPAFNQYWARFAVMVRASTAGNSHMASCVGASSGASFGTKFVYRTSDAGGRAIARPYDDNNQDTPQWLRITRAGTTFTGESSVDGVIWTVLWSATVPSMPETALWGIFHTANDINSSTKVGDYHLATYQNVGFSEIPVPAAPSGFSCGQTLSSSSVNLTWSAVPYAGSYRIERRTESGDFALLAELSGTSLSYSDSSVFPSSSYQYRILASNDSGTSAFSSVVSTATPDPATTLNISAEADATARYDSPSTGFGAADTLTVAGSDVLTSELTPVAKTWLRFDLGGLPPLVTAKLTMTVTSARDMDAGYYYDNLNLLAESSDAWDEATLSWTNAPQNATAGTGVLAPLTYLETYNPVSTPIPGTEVQIDFSADTLNANVGANGKLTIAFIPDVWNDSGEVNFASREHATLPGPTLQVTYYNPTLRPGFLTVAPGEGSAFNITWTDNSDNESGFQLERRAANGAWALVVILPPNSTGYTDTTSQPGVIYEYRLRANNASTPSSWATASTLQHSDVATVSNPAWSPDGVAFNTVDSSSNNGYVPTGFTYFTPTITFAANQTLSATIQNGFQGWLGMKITVGANPITIRELGRWVLAGNTAVHTVKLVDATAKDLPGGAVSIDTAGAPVGFKYASLAIPVILSANTSYYVVSSEVNGGDQFYIGNNFLTSTTGVVAVNHAVYSLYGTSYDKAYSPNNTYGPLNFKYCAGMVPFTTGHRMTTLRNDFTGWLGMEITVGSSPITVAELGRWVVPGNVGTHAVKLVNAFSGADVASVSVATVGATPGQIKSAPLAIPVTLGANTSYFLLSQETAGGDQWHDFAKPAAGTANGYQTWLLANGLPMDASGAGSAAASPASDGLPNLVKCALGISPFASGHGGRLNSGVIRSGGDDFLTLTYVRPDPAPAGLIYTVQTSSDLANWTAVGLVEVSDTVDAGLRTVTVRGASPLTAGSRQFLRLLITQP